MSGSEQWSSSSGLIIVISIAMAAGQTLHQRSSNMNAIDSHSILFKCCPQLPFCLLNMGLFLHAKAAVCYRGNCVLASSNIIPLEVSQAIWCRPVTHARTHTHTHTHTHTTLHLGYMLSFHNWAEWQLWCLVTQLRRSGLAAVNSHSHGECAWGGCMQFAQPDLS